MRVMFIYFNKDFRPRTPLSLSILDTVLKERDHVTNIFDTSFYLEFMNKDEANLIKAGIRKTAKNLDIAPKLTDMYRGLKDRVKNFNPGLIGFSYYSVNEDIQEFLLSKLKCDFPEIKIIAGGPVACINPSRCLESDYVDMVCCGEGEELIQQVCSRMDSGDDLSGIKGLWTRHSVSAGVTDLVDINELPVPNFNSFAQIQRYGLFDGKAYRMGHVEFTRGCPFDCSYCGSGSIRRRYADSGQRGYIRHKDPKHAVAEYKILKEQYDLEMFYFIDGTFTAMPLKVLEELAPLYKKEVGLPFIALVHPNTIKERTAELLGEMGCIHVSIGIESGVEEYRSKILNRKMTNKQIVQAISYLQKNGVKVSAYNMIGLPGMDRKHVFETIKLNKEAKAKTSIISIFMPFPDNNLTKSLIEKNLLDPDKIELTNGLRPSVDIDDMSKEEISGLFNTFNLYVKFPTWAYPFIRLLEKENFATRLVRKLLYKIIK